MSKSELRQGEALEVTFTVTNLDNRPLRVLSWNTPLEGIVGNPFSITLNGEERAYLGAFHLRFKPLPSEYVEIAPGQSVSRTVDLAPYYDLSAAGEYELRARYGHVSDVLAPRERIPADRGQLQREPFTSNTLRFRLVDSGAPPERQRPPPGPTRPLDCQPQPLTFQGCSDTSDLTEAFAAMTSDACTLGSEAPGIFGECLNWNATATDFFGNCDPQNIGPIVVQTTQAIAGFATNTPTTLICGESATLPCGPVSCGANSGAWTCSYAAPILLCPAFLSLPSEGEESMVSVLYHELSHWHGTVDDPCSCGAATDSGTCQNIAATNPGLAATNAYNYQLWGVYQISGDKPCGVEHGAVLTAPFVALFLVVISRRQRSRWRERGATHA